MRKKQNENMIWNKKTKIEKIKIISNQLEFVFQLLDKLLCQFSAYNSRDFRKYQTKLQYINLADPISMWLAPRDNSSIQLQLTVANDIFNASITPQWKVVEDYFSRQHTIPAS